MKEDHDLSKAKTKKADGKSFRISSFRVIEKIVQYFKENNEDLNAVTESLIRRHITSHELLEYYRDKMQNEVKNYRSVVFRMLNMSSAANRERRQKRINLFQNKIIKIINTENNLNRVSNLMCPYA